MSFSKAQLLLLFNLLPVAWCGECKHPAAEQDGSPESCDSEQALLQNRFHHSVTLVEEEGIEDAGAMDDAQVMDNEGLVDDGYHDGDEESNDNDDAEAHVAEAQQASFSELNNSQPAPAEYKGRQDLCFNFYPSKGYFCWHPQTKDDPKRCPTSISSVALRWNNDWFVMKDDASGSSCTKANTLGKGQKMICGAMDGGNRVRKCGKGVECVKGQCKEAVKQQHFWHAGAAKNKLCTGNEVGKTDGAASPMDCKIQCEALGEKCNGFNKMKSGPDRGKCVFFSNPGADCHKNGCPACQDDQSANVYTIYRRKGT